jgi:nicotinamidase-related amidase
MPNTTSLVIVDVQWKFVASRHPLLLDGVLREIRRAKAQNYPIINLVFKGYGPTIEVVQRALDRTDHVNYVKYMDDGSNCVHNYLMSHNLKGKIRFAGVNTCGCVLATAQGLKTYCGLTTHKGLKTYDDTWDPWLIMPACNSETTQEQAEDDDELIDDFAGLKWEGDFMEGFKFEDDEILDTIEDVGISHDDTLRWVDIGIPDYYPPDWNWDENNVRKAIAV